MKSLKKQEEYNPFIPPLLTDNKFDFKDKRIYMLLERAASVLGKLNMLSKNSDFANLFTDMHVYVEAFESSEIEGTHADKTEVVKKDESDKTNRDLTIARNLYNLYLKMNNKLATSKNFSLNISCIEKMHSDLFKNMPKTSNEVGKIRTKQNFVGGTNILDALYIPPPPDKVSNLLEDLNKFWQNRQDFIPYLIKIAIYHYQFETIHPFGDGNGRIGRLITNLQLKECDLLDLPVLCLSNYWKKNKGNYYNAISSARYSNDIEYWIRFFLSSIYSASIERIEAIIKINETLSKHKKILEKGEQDNSNIILTHLIKVSPFITAKEAQELTGSTYQGANKIIEKFVNLGILKEYSQNKRNRIFVFDEYDKLIFNLIDELD